MWLNLKKLIDYKLPHDLEIQFQDETNEWTNRTFLIGIPIISVVLWFVVYLYKDSAIAEKTFQFAAVIQMVLAVGFYSVFLKGASRRAINYVTPIFPLAYVIGLMTIHIPSLQDGILMRQSQNWILCLVFFLYAIERISPLFAALNSFSSTFLFWKLRSKIPEMANIDSFHLGFQLAACHAAGLLICFEHCKNSRSQFKFKKDLEAQRRQSDDLLKNVLPEAIVLS